MRKNQVKHIAMYDITGKKMLPPNFNESLWDADELEIWRTQGFRCIVCGHYADTIHEIIPKSKTKDWKRPDNQVLVCVYCHNHIHKEGAKAWRTILEICRDKAIRTYNVIDIK